MSVLAAGFVLFSSVLTGGGVFAVSQAGAGLEVSLAVWLGVSLLLSLAAYFGLKAMRPKPEIRYVTSDAEDPTPGRPSSASKYKPSNQSQCMMLPEPSSQTDQPEDTDDVGTPLPEPVEEDKLIDEEEDVFTPTTVDAPRGEVTFVFTDIECSSVLWRKHPDEMRIAMRLHNNVIRKTYSMYKGYEVKTIGDAFMLTFNTPANALLFCIETQLKLLEQEWPAAILNDPICAAIHKSDQLIFRGMRVRMGVHTGDVSVEVDPVSGRSDYYGHTVNVAARIESAGTGGSIVVSQSVLGSLGSTPLPATVVRLGQMTLRGVGKVELSGVVPTELSGRGAALATIKPKGNNGNGSSCSPSGSNSVHAVPTPGSSTRPKVLRSLLRDLFNDRVLSDPIIRAAVEGFSSSDELRPLNASVAQIRLGVNVERLATALDVICTLARRTFGIVLSTASTTATVIWICQQHSIQAVSFAGTLSSEYMGSLKMHVGLATGGVLLGVTHPGDDRHFVTCIGSPVELSGALAEAAEQVDARCLVPSSIVACVSSIAKLLRPIDRWPLFGMQQAFIEVSELSVAGLEGAEKWDLMYGMQEDKDWFDPKYKDAFEAARNGDLVPMKALVSRCPDDHIAKMIVNTKGKQLTRTEFIAGQGVKANEHASKEDLEEAWKRTAAASRSARAELVYMEGWAHDVATFVHSHPGGRECFKKWYGKDITDIFHGHGEGAHDHSSYASEILRTLRVFKTVSLATNESNMMIVRDSWKELCSMGLKDIGVLLFRNMFEHNPEFKNLFPWSKTGSVYEKGLQDHGMQVMTAVDKAVTDLSKATEVAHTLHELGKTHIRFGIRRHMFDIMAEAFDDTFRQALQEKYTPQVRYAWKETIGTITQHAKDGIADISEHRNDPLVVDEYRKIRFVSKEKRSENTFLFKFEVYGFNGQHQPPGSHVSIRFDHKLSRAYSILNTEGDVVSFMIKLYDNKVSSNLLRDLSPTSVVEGRGLLLAEYQYQKGYHKELFLLGGGTGCSPLISIARAALKDGCKVVLVGCFDTYDEMPYKTELDELDKMGHFTSKFLFTKSGKFPPNVHPYMANSITEAHLEDIFDSPSETNHVIVCGPDEFNTTARGAALGLGYTLTVMGMLAKRDQPAVGH